MDFFGCIPTSVSKPRGRPACATETGDRSKASGGPERTVRRADVRYTPYKRCELRDRSATSVGQPRAGEAMRGRIMNDINMSVEDCVPISAGVVGQALESGGRRKASGGPERTGRRGNVRYAPYERCDLRDRSATSKGHPRASDAMRGHFSSSLENVTEVVGQALASGGRRKASGGPERVGQRGEVRYMPYKRCELRDRSATSEGHPRAGEAMCGRFVEDFNMSVEDCVPISAGVVGQSLESGGRRKGNGGPERTDRRGNVRYAPYERCELSDRSVTSEGHPCGGEAMRGRIVDDFSSPAENVTEVVGQTLASGGRRKTNSGAGPWDVRYAPYELSDRHYACGWCGHLSPDRWASDRHAADEHPLAVRGHFEHDDEGCCVGPEGTSWQIVRYERNRSSVGEHRVFL